jgi:hypothetical protein
MASYSLIELSPNRRQLATLELVDFGIKRHRSAARISVPNISSRAARQFRMAMRTHAAACAVHFWGRLPVSVQQLPETMRSSTSLR